MKVKCQVSSVKCQVSSLAPGQIVIISLIFLTAAIIFTTALLSRTAGFLRFGGNSLRHQQATSLAEAGIDHALLQLNKTAGSYAGDSQDLSTGSFTVTVTTKTSSLKTVTATGCIPDCSSPRSKRTIKLDTLISAENIAFRYAVQVGTGGVNMENSSTINGTVYSNGNIVGSGTTTIDGDAFAVGTISSPDPFVTGSKHPGSPPSAMPTVDYQYWKDQATAGGTVDCTATPSLCNLANVTTTIGPKKYIGNLTIANGSFVTMDGPVYVTGFVDIKNDFTKLKLNDSFGSNGTVLITDGSIIVQNGGKIEPTNANPKGYILTVTTSTNATEAVNIKNQGANAIFYALDGGATLQNNAQITALVAKSILMKNSAILTYDQGLASTQFSSGPGGAWTVKKGTYRFTSSP